MDGDELRPVRPFGTPWTVGRMVADTCIWVTWRDRPLDPERPAIEELLHLRREGRVEIAKTDTVDTERISGVSKATATDSLLETAGIIELHGPAVFGSSRWGAAVFASQDDKDRLDRVFAVLFPNTDRNAIDSSSKKHKLRDAMHITTSIRYGYDVFLTTDTGFCTGRRPSSENGTSKSCGRAGRFGGRKRELTGKEPQRNGADRSMARWRHE